jgi:hypothetical protein
VCWWKSGGGASGVYVAEGGRNGTLAWRRADFPYKLRRGEAAKAVEASRRSARGVVCWELKGG